MKLIKSIVFNSRMLRPFKNGNQLIIFNYHRLRDHSRPSLFDDFVIGPDALRFRQEMEWIKKETHVLSENELLEMIHSKKEIRGIYSLITFDDGYIDNYNIAFPILKELSLPATFYIPTWSLTERKLGWWDIVAYLIKNTTKEDFIFREKHYTLKNPSLLIKYFNSQLKIMEPSRVFGFLQSLSCALEVNIPLTDLQSHELMDWHHLKELIQNGMSIGTHTHDHVILSKQNLEDIKVQIKKSIDILEAGLGSKIESIAYPVGEYEHFDFDTKKISQELGLKLGFSYQTGVNYWGDIDPFDIKRVSFAPYWPNLDLALAFPERAFPYIKQIKNQQRGIRL